MKKESYFFIIQSLGIFQALPLIKFAFLTNSTEIC